MNLEHTQSIDVVFEHDDVQISQMSVTSIPFKVGDEIFIAVQNYNREKFDVNDLRGYYIVDKINLEFRTHYVNSARQYCFAFVKLKKKK